QHLKSMWPAYERCFHVFRQLASSLTLANATLPRIMWYSWAMLFPAMDCSLTPEPQSPTEVRAFLGLCSYY
ncbi:hypothetical protein GOODEAATRI_026041, partial [Goodea atripinnis]